LDPVAPIRCAGQNLGECLAACLRLQPIQRPWIRLAARRISLCASANDCCFTLAELPHKTRFHELAHVMLGHTSESDAGFTDSDMTPRSLREVEAEAVALVCLEALGLPGAEHARGYIQHWNQRRNAEPIPERSAQRIFKAADLILKAGTTSTARVCPRTASRPDGR
jgi:hypothetical protein